MIFDPLVVPDGSHTVIIKREAVLGSFPGGAEEFERIHEPTLKNEGLYLIITKSAKAAHGLMDRLERTRLQLGVDLAYIGAPYSPNIPCSGLVIESEGAHPYVRWLVSKEADLRSLPAPIDRDGRLLPSLRQSDAGLVIAAREAFGAVDSWDEYLCAFRGTWGFVLNVYRYEWLGEVPEEWYDEDGELLADYRDQMGGLKLPEVMDYRPVLGHAYGGFIGPIVPSNGMDGVQISDCTEEMVLAALEALGWSRDDLTALQQGVHELANVAAEADGRRLVDAA